MTSKCECRDIFSALASVIYVKAREAIVNAPEITAAGCSAKFTGAQAVQDAFVQRAKITHKPQWWLGAPAAAQVAPFAIHLPDKCPKHVEMLPTDFGIPLLFDVPARELLREMFTDAPLAVGIAYATTSMVQAILNVSEFQRVGLFIRCECGECGCTGRFFIAFALSAAEAK